MGEGRDMGSRISRRRQPPATPTKTEAAPPPFENHRRIRFVSETENSGAKKAISPAGGGKAENRLSFTKAQDQAAVHTFGQQPPAEPGSSSGSISEVSLVHLKKNYVSDPGWIRIQWPSDSNTVFVIRIQTQLLKKS